MVRKRDHTFARHLPVLTKHQTLNPCHPVSSGYFTATIFPPIFVFVAAPYKSVCRLACAAFSLSLLRGDISS